MKEVPVNKLNENALHWSITKQLVLLPEYSVCVFHWTKFNQIISMMNQENSFGRK